MRTEENQESGTFQQTTWNKMKLAALIRIAYRRGGGGRAFSQNEYPYVRFSCS
jgi:hypothetical protein